MAGYSSNPLANKLGIKEGISFYALDMPQNVAYELSYTMKVTLRSEELKPETDFIIVFVRDTEILQSRINSWKEHLAKSGMLWISWPKKTSKIETDITREIVREIGLSSGLVDIKVCAVDDDWSGLKVRLSQKKDR